jgi:hypothetical protein
VRVQQTFVHATRDRVLFVERDPSHTCDGIAVQRRQSLNDVEGPLIGRAALSSTSTLSRLGAASGHDIYALLCATLATTPNLIDSLTLLGREPWQ